MIIVSYDIADDITRSRFQKMLCKNGAIRLQHSVYEINNTKRIIENIKLKIVDYSKHFTADDSVVIFEIDKNNMIKYGNEIHRDTDLVFF